MIERALAEWRDAERLLTELPPLHPDHETVRLEIMRLREVYRSLAEIKTHTAEHIDSCATTIERAHALMTAVRLKLEPR